MNVNSNQIDAIVREVLASMGGAKTGGCSSCSGSCGAAPSIPATAKVAMLVGEKNIQVKEFPMPPVGDDDILVQVEGCGVCGTDVHEWKMDPFGIIPVTLGHEGTGTIVAMGKNVKSDTAGKPIKVGDKIVTSVMSCGECGICRMHPAQTNLCDGQGVFGLIQDSEEHHLSGWFSTHLLIKGEKNPTYFVVNDLDLKERMLLELAAVCVHALERGKATGLLNFGSTVVLQGCGPVGLMMLSVLTVAGINNVIAIDGTQQRLDMAKKLGANMTINFSEVKDLETRVKMVKESSLTGLGADFIYQCTGAPRAAADAYEYIRRGGGFCEMGFFVNNGSYEVNPHFAMCQKEINMVGSWDYSAEDYPTTIAFLKQARKLGVPIKDLVTHSYPLDKLNEAMETNVAQKGIKICYVAE
ncbi:GroES-like protein [[Clostridium] methylpentosum DSM 5476]|uniref:GroES-like protein n=1 Tax=[Clostridium] methylpentosum DSM 5476 TaxID=537013 RepID=C0E8B2_9FIRM|nr:GroES-like protein [[Clostridium] methylpentosum DSM 5476]MDY3988394.1 zinc-binding dehydrogenase [Massilioclostridium sp.]MEE1492741.1 zinc-binding dehydrogenase [Massilioclostridium sp.]